MAFNAGPLRNPIFQLMFLVVILIIGSFWMRPTWTNTYIQTLLEQYQPDQITILTKLSHGFNGTILMDSDPVPLERYPEWARTSLDYGYILPPEIWGAVLWNESSSIAFLGPTGTRKWQEVYPKPEIIYPEVYFKLVCVFKDSDTHSNVTIIPDTHHNAFIFSCDLPPEEQDTVNLKQSVRVNLLDLTFGVLSKDYQVASYRKTERHHKIAACVMVLNEAKYVSEWIEYMQLMKVTKFFFYDNGSKDKTFEALQPYVDKGIVTVIDYSAYPYWGEINSQVLAYNDCLYRFKDYSDFQVHMDVDEYPLMMDGHTKDLEHLINYSITALPDFGMTTLTFQYFGTRDWDETKLVTEAFWRAQEPSTWGTQYRKPTYWLKNVQAVSIHMLTTGGPTLNVNPEIMRLNHYWHGNRGMSSDKNEVYDDSMKRYVNKLKCRLDRDD